jgi:hypothetical protein
MSGQVCPQGDRVIAMAQEDPNRTMLRMRNGGMKMLATLERMREQFAPAPNDSPRAAKENSSQYKALERQANSLRKTIKSIERRFNLPPYDPEDGI